MGRKHVVVITGIIVLLSLPVPAPAETPVKWSAPMQEYPNAWAPTAPPPSYNNPWGYQYPYGYGYPPYWNYYQGANQAYRQSQPPAGYSPMPYQDYSQYYGY